jgi:acetyl-CoA carboxylase carboxyl transferase subunit alpha
MKRKNADKEKQSQIYLKWVHLKVPIITIIVGEGASGGALGIEEWEIAFICWKHLVFCDSPESCSLFYGAGKVKKLLQLNLKLTSSDMSKKLIDDIIPEPLEELR